MNCNTRKPTETSAEQSWRWSSDLNEPLIYLLRYCQHYNEVPIVPLVSTVLCLINSAIDVAVAGFRSYINCSFLSIKSTSISAEHCLLHCCYCTSQKMQMSCSYYLFHNDWIYSLRRHSFSSRCCWYWYGIRTITISIITI